MIDKTCFIRYLISDSSEGFKKTLDFPILGYIIPRNAIPNMPSKLLTPDNEWGRKLNILNSIRVFCLPPSFGVRISIEFNYNILDFC